MKNARTIVVLSMLSLGAAPLAACSSESPGSPDVGGSTHPDAGSAVPGDGGKLSSDANDVASADAAVVAGLDASAQIPAPPVLGAQFDRVGRPGVEKLLGTFDTVAVRNPRLDSYNAATPATWSTFAPELKKNLAIFDGIDSTCGNLWWPVADFSTMLADDRLYVDTSQATCPQYMGVEIAASDHSPHGCGGLTPDTDMVDISYMAFTGAAQGAVTDGVSSDVDGIVNINMFPFLAPPN